MNHFKLCGISIVLALLLSACASGPGRTGWYDNWQKCALAGGAAGAVAGVAEDDLLVGGVVGGAVIGGVICAMSDTDGDGVRNHRDKCPGTEAGGMVDARGCETDSDGDGVLDGLDECPGSPQGASVDTRGCEPDSDNDGVVDRLDRCSGTLAGVTVDNSGCELDGDADADGITDRMDKCPATTSGTAVDNSGCALAQAYKLEGVNFETDSANLTTNSNATLDAAVMILKRHTDLQIEIAGHTDNRGAAGYNQALSARRAQAVTDYLVVNGANADNISARGYGDTQPVADNSSEAGRAANRRVELRQK